MVLMTIGEVANEAGVQPSTLRYYESIGLLPLAKRVGGKRRYTAEAIDRLGVIQIAKKAGFTLSEIKVLLSGFSETEPPSAQWKIMAQEKIEQVEALIERAQGMKRLLMEGLECECLRMEECANFINEAG
ncbi:MAG: MerR family transcriptional regulator [Chloroflexi bacterium]|nr:MerR family transcriptional regulator [Chloroflexota bacterium]MCI0807162.1 MerR family transcriptional regulator [Chloroflexota bacterium]MCI0828043.1 MerR family transcriptional regulator [Chloroflexota bacterium]MCI0854873.1 MerR family transcriptional regulator [Chloroflexota bacterium]MCI0876826.1 MerR family transcriptional regulator [Chloroflexota bacterium]